MTATGAAPPAIRAEGSCDPRFARVREAFEQNFVAHGEVGAALCVKVGGHTVVDLWGGHRDRERTRPWRRDTLVNAYSNGKGVLSLLVLSLVDEGVLDWDAPVASHWPEFAAEGKGDVTLRTLLTHRGGLPGVRERLPEGAMLDWTTMCDALARTRPWWEPGTRHGYHVNSFGFLVGEVVRRAAGRRVGAVLAERLAGPVGAEFYWGLPARHHARVAPIVNPSAEIVFGSREQWAAAFPATGDDEYDTMRWHSYFNPSGFSGMGAVNTEAWREAEVPATNGTADARALARLYDLLFDRPGRRAVAARGLVEEAGREHVRGEDYLLGRETAFGLGFQRSCPGREIGRGPRAFGHFGYGGSLGFADLDADLAFGYLMNLPGNRWPTPRADALIDAVYECLG